MNQIMAFVIAGLLLLAVLVYWVQRSRSQDVKKETEGLEEQRILACLQFEVLTKAFVERVFSEQDWAFISGRTNRAVRRLFQTQRRRLAMIWLRRTRKQVTQLMTFYRAAVRQKIDVTAAVEMRVALDYMLFLLTYYVLLISVWLRGPMQARKMMGYAVGYTSQLCSSCRHLFPTVKAVDSMRIETVSTGRLIARQ